MIIRLIKKMPRPETIPGALSAEEYRALKAGEAIEISGAAAQSLIAGGYAETVEIVEETKTDKELEE